MSGLPPLEALSGITGSISLACWIFVLVPQLLENYRLGSAEGLSVYFLAVWFIGDLTNLIGALWAGLVPTVIALAVYFCIADAVLILQWLYYKHVNSKKTSSQHDESTEPNDPTQPLIHRKTSNIGLPGSRRRSTLSQNRAQSLLDNERPSSSRLWTILSNSWLRNSAAVLAICALGTAGWAVAWQAGLWKPVHLDADSSKGETNVGAAVLGYFSALCYLGARIPQIIKNFRERSCEGLSVLFFILSLLGNLFYGGGILFHSVDKDYILVNLPWLIGSLGTIVEDVTIFVQFRMYRDNQGEEESAVT